MSAPSAESTPPDRVVDAVRELLDALPDKPGLAACLDEGRAVAGIVAVYAHPSELSGQLAMPALAGAKVLVRWEFEKDGDAMGWRPNGRHVADVRVAEGADQSFTVVPDAGSVIVDVAIDQGGCFETSKATTHGEPIYTVEGVVHYCVANMPGAVPKTSTLALTNATLPYAVEIANKGWKKAMKQNPEIKSGANVVKGKVTYRGVAEAFGLKFTSIDRLLK